MYDKTHRQSRFALINTTSSAYTVVHLSKRMDKITNIFPLKTLLQIYTKQREIIQICYRNLLHLT